MDDFGEDFLGEGAMQQMSGPLIGGGLAQVGILATKAFAPKFAKYAGIIGAVLGGGVSAFLMSKPQHRDKGLAGLATALVVGVPRAIEDLMLPAMGLKGFDGLDAYTPEGLSAYTSEGMGGPLEVLSESPGSPGLLSAMGQDDMAGDLGADIEVSGNAFGATL
jgi:hypothetical protein